MNGYYTKILSSQKDLDSLSIWNAVPSGSLIDEGLILVFLIYSNIRLTSLLHST
jgi:hypothetical protein